jgi:hypothetical protein
MRPFAAVPPTAKHCGSLVDTSTGRRDGARAQDALARSQNVTVVPPRKFRHLLVERVAVVTAPANDCFTAVNF